jgi:hypothetical protein
MEGIKRMILLLDIEDDKSRIILLQILCGVCLSGSAGYK